MYIVYMALHVPLSRLWADLLLQREGNGRTDYLSLPLEALGIHCVLLQFQPGLRTGEPVYRSIQGRQRIVIKAVGRAQCQEEIVIVVFPI
jgi:hypothetical protein